MTGTIIAILVLILSFLITSGILKIGPRLNIAPLPPRNEKNGIKYRIYAIAIMLAGVSITIIATMEQANTGQFKVKYALYAAFLLMIATIYRYHKVRGRHK